MTSGDLKIMASDDDDGINDINDKYDNDSVDDHCDIRGVIIMMMMFMNMMLMMMVTVMMMLEMIMVVAVMLIMII